jgi:hypothetical protein
VREVPCLPGKVVHGPPAGGIAVHELQGAADDRILERCEPALGARREASGVTADDLDEQQFHQASQHEIGPGSRSVGDQEDLLHRGGDELLTLSSVRSTNKRGKELRTGAQGNSKDSMKPHTMRVVSPPPP